MGVNEQYGAMQNSRQQTLQRNNSAAQSEWEKMLAQARMAMMMDGKTALGLALGKLIRGAWDHEQDAARRRKDAKIADESKQNNATGLNNGQPPVSFADGERYREIVNDVMPASLQQMNNDYTFRNGIQDMYGSGQSGNDVSILKPVQLLPGFEEKNKFRNPMDDFTNPQEPTWKQYEFLIGRF